MKFGVIPESILEAALMSYLPISCRDEGPVESPVLKAVLFPVRAAVYCGLMCAFYPVMLTVAVGSALYLRATKGTPADILAASLKSSFKTGASYPCIFVFKKPFEDKEKLAREWKALAAELGMPDEAKVGISFETETPKPFPESSCLAADHCVDKGFNMFKRATLLMGGFHTYIQVYNGAVGSPTVLRCYLPGHTFDGTSCFNIVKELINRYYGEKSKVVINTSLTKEADTKLRGISFLGYLLRLPFNVLVNVSDFNWMFVTSMVVFGGPGMSTELAMLNYDEDESARLVSGLKKKGIKPYAGMIHAAFQAYKHVEGTNPYSIMQQASMQSRLYAPDPSDGIDSDTFTKARRFVGDWLIGIPHYFSRGDFTVDDAQEVYNSLLSDLKNVEGGAQTAAMAKAYCCLAGAGVFQFFPFYGDNARVMDGIFFNNYGKRTITEKAELYSYNWGAPFRMGFNTLSVNGKTCTCLASSHMSLKKLEKARDHADQVLRGFMD